MRVYDFEHWQEVGIATGPEADYAQSLSHGEAIRVVFNMTGNLYTRLTGRSAGGQRGALNGIIIKKLKEFKL